MTCPCDGPPGCSPGGSSTGDWHARLPLAGKAPIPLPLPPRAKTPIGGGVGFGCSIVLSAPTPELDQVGGAMLGGGFASGSGEGAGEGELGGVADASGDGTERVAGFA